MPIPEFHKYTRRVIAASRRADTSATPAQREAGNARVGKVHIHGFELSIEYPKGAIRSGFGSDGKKWSRVVNNPYGYINRTKSEDGEQLDVWLGEHPESQLVFAFYFLDAEGNHDEIKMVFGVRNLAEAKKVIRDNYPANWIEERVGEIRGLIITDFRKFLEKEGLVKERRKKAFVEAA